MQLRTSARRRSSPAPPPADEDVDLADLVDVPPEPSSSPVDRLLQAFPAPRSSTSAPDGRLHPAGPGADRRARPLPGIGPKSAQRIAFHLLEAAGRRRRPAGDVDHRRQGAGCASACAAGTSPTASCARSASTIGATPTRAVRRRGVARHRRHREDRRVQRPLPRAARGDEPARRHRPGAAEDEGAVRPPRARGRARGDPVHQPEHRGRGDGDVPRPHARSRSASR